jgi:hypothetical protein
MQGILSAINIQHCAHVNGVDDCSPLLSEPGTKNGWGPAIVAFVAIGAHAVAIVIHHLQLGMFENVLPLLLEAIHHILIWPILKTLGWIDLLC